MAISAGLAQGRLARATAEIRERNQAGKEEPPPARRALRLADELLEDLEELLLHGFAEAPSWCRASATALRCAATRAGVPDIKLESEAGVLKLMEDVYELEARLLRRLRPRRLALISRERSPYRSA